MHADEIPIDEALVRRLVDSQFPHYAALGIHALGSSGSSNVLFRLGDDMLARFPRQPGGGDSIVKEADWLPKIGEQLTVRVPEVLAVGDPTEAYGEHWSIVRWLNGEHPSVGSPGESAGEEPHAIASNLADAILALRSCEIQGSALTDVRLRSYRGEALVGFDEQTRRNIDACRSIDGLQLDLNLALELWEDSLTLPGAHAVGPDRWYHGDLVAENLLVVGGRLTGVLDFGGLGVGDPTVDLHGAWEVLDASGRDVFRQRLGVDDPEWFRGRAWALGIGLGVLPYYWERMPNRCQDRLAMVRATIADFRAGT